MRPGLPPDMPAVWRFGSNAEIDSSLALTRDIAGTNTVAGLVAQSAAPTSVADSYWNVVSFTDGSGMMKDRVSHGDGSAGVNGEAKTTTELQSPTGFTGSIYEGWRQRLVP